MSKRKKKRGGGRSPYEGYETEVWGSSPIQIAAIEKEYRSMEEESFQMGAEDREQNRRKMDYHEFALDFAALPLPRGIITEIARANYATYLDAYKGKAFKAHIICKVLSLEGDAVRQEAENITSSVRVSRTRLSRSAGGAAGRLRSWRSFPA